MNVSAWHSRRVAMRALVKTTGHQAIDICSIDSQIAHWFIFQELKIYKKRHWLKMAIPGIRSLQSLFTNLSQLFPDCINHHLNKILLRNTMVGCEIMAWLPRLRLIRDSTVFLLGHQGVQKVSVNVWNYDRKLHSYWDRMRLGWLYELSKIGDGEVSRFFMAERCRIQLDRRHLTGGWLVTMTHAPITESTTHCLWETT